MVLDLDECTTNSHTCDVNAICQNTVGSHTCSCKAGYTGDGKTCNGKLENKRENTSYSEVCRFSLQLSYFKIILSLILPTKRPAQETHMAHFENRFYYIFSCPHYLYLFVVVPISPQIERKRPEGYVVINLLAERKL